MKLTLKLFCSLLVLLFAFGVALAETYPSKAIEVVIPFKAGGGSDTLARLFQKALEKYLPQPIVVVNVPGGFGIIGDRKAKNAKPDGYTLLLQHATLLTAAAQGTADFGPEAFDVVAGTATANMVVCVAKNSSYKTLKDLLEAAKAKPNQIRVVTNIGAVVHFAWLKLSDVGGDVKFRYIQSGGGAKRLAQIVGGHADASIFATSEAKQYYDSGDLRILAILAKERQWDLPKVPTAKELGYNTQTAYDWWWFAPKGTPKDRIDYMAGVLKKTVADPYVKKMLNKQSYMDTYMAGEAAQKKIASDYAYLKILAKKFGMIKKKKK